MSLPTSQDFPRVETLLFLLNSPPPLVMEAELSKVKAPNWDEIEILVCKKAAYEVSTSNGIVKKGSLAQQTADCYRRQARLLCGPGGLQPWVDRPPTRKQTVTSVKPWHTTQRAHNLPPVSDLYSAFFCTCDTAVRP